MNYTEALAWVHGLKRISGDAAQTRMKALLAALGNPQRRLAFVHVAGTNGKGSTVAMLASVLRCAGYKTGANISPYVLDFRERFQINGEMIGREVLASLLNDVRTAAEAAGVVPIEFGAVTAAALLWFAREKCDIVCLEAGIGGRHDSTNVIENTQVAILTRIGLDHTEILGDTVEAIAQEKCGILKNRCEAVSYPLQQPEAAAVIARCAAAAGCPLTLPDPQDLHLYGVLPRPGWPPSFANRANYGGYELDIPFPGAHQALNAAVAVEGALALCRKGYAIEDEHIQQGIKEAVMPARIEILGRSPLVILDGAHNTDSAAALAGTLEAAGLTGLVAVAGVLADKQAAEMLAVLAPYIRTLYTVTPNSPRALPAEELAALAKKMIRHRYVCESVADALELAQEEAVDASGLLVFGSLYLAAEARRRLVPAVE